MVSPYHSTIILSPSFWGVGPRRGKKRNELVNQEFIAMMDGRIDGV